MYHVVVDNGVLQAAFQQQQPHRSRMYLVEYQCHPTMEPEPHSEKSWDHNTVRDDAPLPVEGTVQHVDVEPNQHPPKLPSCREVGHHNNEEEEAVMEDEKELDLPREMVQEAE